MNLTIIVPSKERINHVKRLLLYYKKIKFNGKILIIDSSPKKIFLQKKKIVKDHKQLNVKIFHYIGWEKEATKYGASKIKSKYTLWSADDDFYYLDAIKKTIKFLENKNNKHYIAAYGKGILVEYKNNDLTKPIGISEYTSLKDASQNKSYERVKFILHNYFVPMFAVTRTFYFKKIMSHSPSKVNRKLLPEKLFNSELFTSLITLSYGKIKKINDVYLVRVIGHKRTDLKKNSKKGNKFVISENFTINELSKIISRLDRISFSYVKSNLKKEFKKSFRNKVIFGKGVILKNILIRIFLPILRPANKIIQSLKDESLHLSSIQKKNNSNYKKYELLTNFLSNRSKINKSEINKI